ncbi:hypothetical protein LTR37_020061 [Vermiconidia calcicola]|uniref:Uncharacterized protein n=1 Tax=Vermiconidia calcicola TaxID=1690605 RepID=A0ACC3MCI1_9PEZI|nr:hypothetical protein LTR37_020061 [Vermiconidia calcicola]
MAAQQKRMLKAPTSKLGKIDIVLKALLRQDDAWTLLPQETRETLYSLLPEPQDGDPPHDPDVHPLKTHYKPYIEEELRRWQEDLKDGREVKKWREEAMQAGKDRAEGKFDEWKEMQREEYWGKPEEQENVEGGVKNERNEENGEAIEVRDSQDEDSGEAGGIN